MSYRFDALARYNAEVARGIVHTEEWKAKMAEEQRAFADERGDAARAALRSTGCQYETGLCACPSDPPWTWCLAPKPPIKAPERTDG